MSEIERDVERAVALLQAGRDPRQVLQALVANVQGRSQGGSRCQGCGSANALCPTCYAKWRVGSMAIDFLAGVEDRQGEPAQGPPTYMPSEAARGLRYAEPPLGPTYEDLHRPRGVPPPPPGPQKF